MRTPHLPTMQRRASLDQRSILRAILPLENAPHARELCSILLDARSTFTRCSRDVHSTFAGACSAKLRAQPVGDRAEHLATNVQRRQRSIAQLARAVVERTVRIGEKEMIRLGEH